MLKGIVVSTGDEGETCSFYGLRSFPLAMAFLEAITSPSTALSVDRLWPFPFPFFLISARRRRITSSMSTNRRPLLLVWTFALAITLAIFKSPQLNKKYEAG